MKKLRIGKIILILIALFLLLILFSGITRATDNAEKTVGQFDVLAHYCPWYAIPWPWHVYTTPLRGFYNSYDLMVAAEQNVEKNNYGIDVDLISWGGPIEGNLQPWMLAGYFSAYNLSTRKFAIVYEILALLGNKDCWDFNDPFLEQKFLYDIDYLMNTFFAWFPENVYKIDNKPVVYLWLPWFKNFGRVSQKAREKVYLVGSELMMYPPDDNDKERIQALKWYDAITSYGIDPIGWAQKYGGVTTEALKEYVQSIIRWDRLLKLYAPKTELILPLQFAYHDNRGDIDSQGRTRILTSTPEQAEALAKTVRFLANITGRRRIFLVSYNEHYEGTGAEASVEYGYFWLSLIKKYFTDNSLTQVKTDFRIRNAIYETQRITKNYKSK